MPYALPTVDAFKAQFVRDFPFAVPAYGARGTLTVVAGVITAAALVAGGAGYLTAPDCAIVSDAGSGATITATISNGKVTGFTVTAGGTGYSDDATLAITGGAGDETDLTRVRDADIDGGIADAAYNVNQDLFSTEAGFQRAFLYLAAHCLCERMLAAGQGIRSRYNWLTSAKTVGDLSESFQIPKDILENPYLAAISKTRYGAMYLQIVTPLLVGNMMTSFRVTLP